MKKVQVLGTGCPKCKKLYETVCRVVQDKGLDAEVSKVQDMNDIMKAGVMMVPALVVDGVVKAIGRVPGADEMVTLLS